MCTSATCGASSWWISHNTYWTFLQNWLGNYKWTLSVILSRGSCASDASGRERAKGARHRSTPILLCNCLIELAADELRRPRNNTLPACTIQYTMCYKLHISGSPFVGTLCRPRLAVPTTHHALIFFRNEEQLMSMTDETDIKQMTGITQSY